MVSFLALVMRFTFGIYIYIYIGVALIVVVHCLVGSKVAFAGRVSEEPCAHGCRLCVPGRPFMHCKTLQQSQASCRPVAIAEFLLVSRVV